jgi:hypothetical protein
MTSGNMVRITIQLDLHAANAPFCIKVITSFYKRIELYNPENAASAVFFPSHFL